MRSSLAARKGPWRNGTRDSTHSAMAFLVIERVAAESPAETKGTSLIPAISLLPALPSVEIDPRTQPLAASPPASGLRSPIVFCLPTMTSFSGAMVCAAFAIIAFQALASPAMADGIGVNWGTMMSHPILPTIVVQMLKDNGIQKVKLFDADPWTVGALAGTGIEVMLAIPNDQLARFSGKSEHANEWVKENVTQYDHDGGVNIKYVAVGNEPFLTSYNGSFLNTTLPALKNIQRALDNAGVGDRIKAVVPCNADVYASPSDNPVPSAGDFRDDIRDLMVQIVSFLHAKGAPFVVNIYPYLSLYQNPNFPIDFAFFDGGSKPVADKGVEYTNVFDANYDTLISSLKKAGAPAMEVIVGEIGWPTDGNNKANKEYAKRFYDGFFRKLAKNEGTPLRPGKLEFYLFGLLDEDMKSVLPGNFERHWGLFSYDGRPKFPLDMTGKGNDNYLIGAKGVQYLPAQWCVFNEDAKDKFKSIPTSVNYACSNGDCTPLGYGSSCNGMNSSSNISYAFNIYFQTMDQDVRSCDFNGLAKIVNTNMSEGNCLFPVQILSNAKRSEAVSLVTFLASLLVIMVLPA